MRWLALWAMKLRMLLGRGTAGMKLDDELGFHLERQIVENIAAGTRSQAHAISRLQIVRFYAAHRPVQSRQLFGSHLLDPFEHLAGTMIRE